jgi:hypothetical protein
VRSSARLCCSLGVQREREPDHILPSAERLVKANVRKRFCGRMQAEAHRTQPRPMTLVRLSVCFDTIPVDC